MKHISVAKQMLLVACGALMVLTTGCIREDLDACPSHKLTVKAVRLSGDEFTESAGDDIDEVTVFIFDENMQHLSTHHMTVSDVENRKKIDLLYPEGKKIYAVAWGNAYGGNQDVNEAKALEQLQVSLKKQQENANMPDQLYHGKTEFITKSALEETVDTVTIKVMVGSMQITSKNMPESFKSSLKANAAELYVNRTVGAWNYNGELVGDSVYYTPDPTMDQQKRELDTGEHYYAPGQNMEVTFNIPGVTNSVNRAIYDLATGEALFVEPETTTYAELEWDGDGNFLGMNITVRKWGVVEDPHEL